MREGIERNNFDKEASDKEKQDLHEVVDQNAEVEDTPEEESIDEGRGILIRKKTLYHGSGTPGIESFEKAEETTIGEGVYFTSKFQDAVGYAKRRTRRSKESIPMVYEVSVENMKVLDLREDKNVKEVMESLRSKLEEELQKPSIPWYYEAKLKKSIKAIVKGEINAGNIREIGFNLGSQFTEHVRSLGYEGLVALEGGEGADIGLHDSYVILFSVYN